MRTIYEEWIEKEGKTVQTEVWKTLDATFKKNEMPIGRPAVRWDNLNKENTKSKERDIQKQVRRTLARMFLDNKSHMGIAEDEMIEAITKKGGLAEKLAVKVQEKWHTEDQARRRREIAEANAILMLSITSAMVMISDEKLEAVQTTGAITLVCASAIVWTANWIGWKKGYERITKGEKV